MGAAGCKREPCGCEEVTQTIFACGPAELSTSEHAPTKYSGAEALPPGDTVSTARASNTAGGAGYSGSTDRFLFADRAGTLVGGDACSVGTSERLGPLQANTERSCSGAASENRTKNDPWKVALDGGAMYEGPWLGSLKHGQGTLVLADGTRYTGQFQHDQKSGYGTYSYPSGSTYSGQWADDLQNGHGAENWADGSTFEGQFASGEKHGWGRFSWGNGCLYEGEFERNDMHGEGSYAWSDGRMYSGQWAHNFMGPTGSMQWTDGRVYDGEFHDGRKHGEGTHWWPDGRSYRGQWREGRQHGTGVARTAKGMECKGFWQDGKFVRWLDMLAPGSELAVPIPDCPKVQMMTRPAHSGGDSAAGVPQADEGLAAAAAVVDMSSAPAGVGDAL
mmetsp:Transcript_70280/g.195601  ORF Transcript_70280/g.195601 Transcript_70280/m.195601 type:complete len:390 (-) Transcript_70280:202-1371(-)